MWKIDLKHNLKINVSKSEDQNGQTWNVQSYQGGLVWHQCKKSWQTSL